MKFECPHCGAKLETTEKPSQRHIETRCWMCSRTVRFTVPAITDPGVTINTKEIAERGRAHGASRLGPEDAPGTITLGLPQGKTVVIEVVSGPSAGFRRELTHPLVTLGRAGGGAEIQINDPEVSRLHCSIEGRNGALYLQDLNSTNGTYVGEKRVLAARLENDAEFRIGKSILRIIVSAK